MNLAELLQANARSEPSTPALIVAGRRPRQITFGALDEAAARAAGLLHASGLRPGDTVLVFQPISIELYVALAAIFRLGLMAMFVDPSAGRRQLDRCCELRPPRALIASTKAHLLRCVCGRLAAIPIQFVTGPYAPGAIPWSRLRRAAPWSAIASVAADDPALVSFTSGSTGEPKVVVRSHGFLREQHRVLQQVLGSQPGEIDLATMPIVLLANLAAGVTSLIPDVDLRRPGRVNPARLVRRMQAHKLATAVASPALFERLAGYCREHGVTFPDIRRLTTGGAPVLPRLFAELQALAPAAEVTAVYGSTEAEPMARLDAADVRPEDHEAMRQGRGLLAGRPVPEIELRILPDLWGQAIGPYDSTDFAAACQPPNQAGEIVVHGAHVLNSGGGSEHEPTSFQVDGQPWHRTGDAGYLDHEGRLWLLGRCAARIDDRRGVLYPLAAEAPCYDDPRVRRSALVAHRGRRILLVEGGHRRRRPSLAGLAPLGERLQLDEIRLCRQIPVDARHNAKVDYPRLRRMLDRLVG